MERAPLRLPRKCRAPVGTNQPQTSYLDVSCLIDLRCADRWSIGGPGPKAPSRCAALPVRRLVATVEAPKDPSAPTKPVAGRLPGCVAPVGRTPPRGMGAGLESLNGARLNAPVRSRGVPAVPGWGWLPREGVHHHLARPGVQAHPSAAHPRFWVYRVNTYVNVVVVNKHPGFLWITCLAPAHLRVADRKTVGTLCEKLSRNSEQLFTGFPLLKVVPFTPPSDPHHFWWVVPGVIHT